MGLFLILLKDFIIMPIISLIALIILFLRINNVKYFLKNNFEVEAKIEKYLAYYGSKNYTQKEGSETAIRIIFLYVIDNIEYKKGYSLAKNKYTIEYFDLYKRQGEMVKILVSNKNYKKIMIKELFN
jgi:hypothetical protein